MSDIKILDKEFTPYLSKEEIDQHISEIAEKINKDYAGKKPLFLGILNGAFMFASDLFKKITIDAEISFIKLASYKGTESTGKVYTAIGLDKSLKDRDVIIVEDIIDTGNTMHSFIPELKNQQPNSIALAVLLNKPEAMQHDIEIDYCCFKIPNKFIVGFGLDYDGLGRNIPAIYQIKD